VIKQPPESYSVPALLRAIEELDKRADSLPFGVSSVVAKACAEILARAAELTRQEGLMPQQGEISAISPSQDIRLFDSQWVNVVNHDNCYRGWSKEDAVNHAVRMTEGYMKENITKGWPNPRAGATP